MNIVGQFTADESGNAILTIPGSAAGVNVRQAARRSKRWTFMPCGFFGHTQPGSVGQADAGTQSVAVSCPDDFFAVRVGFIQVDQNPAFSVPLIKACASTGLADGLNPIGGGPWVTVTAAAGGVDSDRLATAANRVAALPVPAATPDPLTGGAAGARVAWSDWTPLQSAAPDASGRRWCFIRHLIPAGAMFSYSIGNYPGLLDGSAENKGAGYSFIPHDCFIADYVTACVTTDNMANLGVSFADTYKWWVGSPLAIVQFMTVRDGVTIMAVGDSHHSGLSTTGDANSCVFQAASSIGQALTGKLPVGIVNAGWPGANAEQFFGAATALLPAVKPSVVVLPGWTFNQTDANGVQGSAGGNALFLGQLLKFADLCVQHGAIPVFTTPWPRDPGNMSDGTRLAAWRALRQTILNMRSSGAAVVDCSPLLSATDGGGNLTGTYLPGLSNDTVHPNDAGHAVIANALRPVLAQVIPLPV